MGTRNDGWSVTGMAYQGKWTSTDQIAQRAIDSGRGRIVLAALDPTTGGETFRYSLSGEWAKRWDKVQSKANVWCAASSGLDLWSNFQYCLNDYANSGTCRHRATSSSSPNAGPGRRALPHHTRCTSAGVQFEVENIPSVCRGASTDLNPVGLYATSGPPNR